jgi:hypothetical protein
VAGGLARRFTRAQAKNREQARGLHTRDLHRLHFPFMRSLTFALLGPIVLISACCARAQNPPSTAPAAAQAKLPHLDVDVKNKKIRVECAALRPQMPLEFFAVVAGTNEHESVLRSPVKPSDLLLAMLMLGLKPGEPVHWSESKQTWLPPHGPPIQIFCEFERAGKTVHVPAYRMMRSVATKKDMPPITWIFAGSRVMEDGNYAADATGYLVSVVNFDLTVIDIPQLASNSNETLQWEVNRDVSPDTGTAVTMIIEPTGEADTAAATSQPAGATTQPMSDVHLNDAAMKQLHDRWEQAVAPHAEALREAAQAHYEVIGAMRREQQRLIDEADRIQRAIDELEKQYQEMTTPRPEPTTNE